MDGKDTGKKTPAHLMLDPGPHAITLRNAGYMDAALTANLKSGETVNLSQDLKQLGDTKEIKAVTGFKRIFGGNEKMCRVSVKSHPKGAQVKVNGQVVSRATPLEFDLNPGSYEVTLTLDGYTPVTKIVEAQAGGHLEVEETLTKK